MVVEQDGPASSCFALTFLHPGVYCLSVTDVRARLLDSVGAGHSNVAIYPMYVLASS
jgi:hypothetical protein